MYFVRKNLDDFDKEKPEELQDTIYSTYDRIYASQKHKCKDRQRERERERERKKSLRASILLMRKKKCHDRRFKSLCLNINPHYYIPAKNRRIKRN